MCLSFTRVRGVECALPPFFQYHSIFIAYRLVCLGPVLACVLACGGTGLALLLLMIARDGEEREPSPFIDSY